MPKKKDEKKRALKPITFKFSLKNGGTVTFKGLWEDKESGDYESLPKNIVEVLEQYGFEVQEYNQAMDCIAPVDDFSIDEALEYIVDVAPVVIEATSKGEGKKRKPVYVAGIDEADSMEGKSVLDALSKAFVQWNKQGRMIEGAPFETVLTDIVDTVNEERANG